MSLPTYGLAFLEGVGLIFSPCILPILPIVLSLGIEGPKRRPYGIIVGFVTSFAALTLLSRHLVATLGIDIEILRTLSFLLLFFFGVILLSDYLSEKFTTWTGRFAHLGERVAQKQSNRPGFASGLVMGMAIGFIWVPCAGPIMAAVIVQTVTQQTTANTVFTLLAFSLGAAIPMLFLVLMGRRILNQVSFLKLYTHVIRKILGTIIIMSVILSAWPGRIWSSQSLEVGAIYSNSGLKNGLNAPYKASEIIGVLN